MYAISEVRVIVPRAFRSRMAHATVRLYDAEHESVYSEHLRGSSATWELAPPPDLHARYVRVGYENKERSQAGTFWHLGLSELEVYGCPEAEVGVLEFEADRNQIQSGDPIALEWRGEQLTQLELYPGSLLSLGEEEGPSPSVGSSGSSALHNLEAVRYTMTDARSLEIPDSDGVPRVCLNEPLSAR